MGANVFSRPQTQHDAVRFFSQLTRLQFDLARRWQTPGTVLEFSDTEEVTGSNPVRPTPFFEILSSAGSQGGSHAPAVMPNKRWSQRRHSGFCISRPGGSGQLGALSRGRHRVRQPSRHPWTSRTVSAA